MITPEEENERRRGRGEAEAGVGSMKRRAHCHPIAPPKSPLRVKQNYPNPYMIVPM
jgi:hypothetical protein